MRLISLILDEIYKALLNIPDGCLGLDTQRQNNLSAAGVIFSLIVTLELEPYLELLGGRFKVKKCKTGPWCVFIS